MLIHLRLTFLLLLITSVAFGQREYTSTNQKAIKALEAGLRMYEIRNDVDALKAIDNAISIDPQFVEAHMLKANIYSDEKKYETAIESYKKAIEINPDFFPNNFYSVAKAEYLFGKYSDAKLHFEKYISYPKANSVLKSNSERMIANCAFAELAVKNPVPFEPINMGDSINTADEEYFPAITGDGKTFLFTRRLQTTDDAGRRGLQEDFFVSKNVNGKWSLAQPVSEINTVGNEGAPSLSADGQYLFFTACEELYSNSNARKTKGSCDIFIAKKVNDQYQKPRNLEEPINTGTWESQPSFSSDGRTLYFVRKIKDADGKSQRDILMSRIQDNSQWSEPVSVSDKINTPFDENSVFIHPDDQTLYFSSDGHPGMGGLDIFMSKRQPDGNWGEPINLGYPINTADDENSLLVSPDGKTAYFASDRNGGKGKLDLYQFKLYDKVRPELITYMKGKVFDADTKKPLFAVFELIDLATQKTVISSVSNSGNGEFLVCLPAGKRYALNVSRDGYLFYSDHFELKGNATSLEPFLKDVPLLPIKAGEHMVLKNIFYDTNKFDLRDESKAELNKLVVFLLKNPNVKFEISGHTDNVGGKQYNQTLSEHRANSVLEYLIANKIDASRITSKGYGDSKPIADNTTEEGRAQNRRTEFLITSN